MTDHAMPRGPKCWACTINEKYRNTGMALSAYLTYEQLVEWVEENGHAPFSVHDLYVANATFRGPTVYNLARHVVKDMRLHGLLECVRRRYAGGPCYGWKLKQGLSWKPQ